MESDQRRLSPRSARQGVTGQRVRYVLMAGLALAVIAWIIVEYAVK